MTQPLYWTCHPDLGDEWDLFARDCDTNTLTNFNSDLWVNFWQRGNILIKTTDNQNEEPSYPSYHSKGSHNKSIECDTELPTTPSVVNTDIITTLTESEQQQVSGVVSEFLDVLDMASESIPEDLKDDVKLFPPLAVQFFYKELQLRLSNQGFYSICNLLCNDTSPKFWIDIGLVFEKICLPKLLENTQYSLGEEIKAGLKLLTEHFPSDCVSHMLIPLLFNNATAPSHLELLSDLIPALPTSNFCSLLRDFIMQCKAPLEEWKISVLTNFLSIDGVEEVLMKTDSPLLTLLPVLSLSARALSANESFATLLLRIIPALKCNNSPQVLQEITAIVQQSNSFNKQTMLNALKN